MAITVTLEVNEIYYALSHKHRFSEGSERQQSNNASSYTCISKVFSTRRVIRNERIAVKEQKGALRMQW